MGKPEFFSSFEEVGYPCLLLTNDGELLFNEAARRAGPPLNDVPTITRIMLSAQLEMRTSGKERMVRPLLGDVIAKRNLTLMANAEGLLAVASDEEELPTYYFTGEMRDHLSNIFATLPMLENKLYSSDRYLAEQVRSQSYQLLRMATNVENAVLAERKSYVVKLLDLTQFVDSVCYDVSKVLSHRRDLPITCVVPQESLYVYADAYLLCNALVNLIRNSIVYTKDFNEIIIKLEKLGKRALLSVSDKGLGIKNEYLSKIFQPMFSVDPYGDSSLRPGMGLGLSFVHEVITGFGGSVKAESVFGEGTTIYMTLDLADDATEEEVLSSSPVNYITDIFSPIFVQLSGYCHMPTMVGVRNS